MLIDFSVENFTSIDKIQKLCMTTGKVRSKMEHLYRDNKINLLRFSAIYGSNASGKSNLVNAIEFAQMTILYGIPKGCTNSYNRTNKNNINRPTLFEFKLKIKNKLYKYGFKIFLNKSSICAEWLYDISSKNKETLVFERNLIDNNYHLGELLIKSKAAERVKIYFEDTKEIDTILFLHEMNRNKGEIYRQDCKLNIFRDVYGWFKHSLDVNYPDRPISNFSYFTSTEQSEEVEQVLKYFGQGIIDFKVVEADKEEYNSKIPNDLIKDFQEQVESRMAKANKAGKEIKPISGMIRGDKDIFIIEVDKQCKVHIKTIKFSHGKAGRYDISEESDGTRRILELIEILFSTNTNKVYVIDEIDRSLHPAMTKEFIEYYLRTLKERNVQLIVTTHELQLLDLNVLRRDEIWFINKDDSGNSELYSLEAFNERFDTRVDKAYLHGRYNAIPSFGVNE